jgi:hypothetical protein
MGEAGLWIIWRGLAAASGQYEGAAFNVQFMMMVPATRTVSRTVEQRKNAEGFPKAGELIEIRPAQELSLHDRRVFNLLIEHAGSAIGENRRHRVPISYLRGPRHNGSERVGDSIRRLMTTLVQIPMLDDNERPAVQETTLLAESTRTIDEDDPRGMVVYAFSAALRDIILQSRYWGRIKAYVMFAISSKYTLALYEAVCLRANRQAAQERFTVEDFRGLLDVPDGKLLEAFNLIKWAVQPAVNELNALSDFNVVVDLVREGGKARGRLIALRLAWTRKSPDEWRRTLNELKFTGKEVCG